MEQEVTWNYVNDYVLEMLIAITKEEKYTIIDEKINCLETFFEECYCNDAFKSKHWKKVQEIMSMLKKRDITRGEFSQKLLSIFI